jgi:hypothetical protein
MIDYKEFYKGVPYSKRKIFLLKAKAYGQLRRHVIHELGYDYNGLKINRAIRVFADFYDLKLTTPYRDWLYNLYFSGENEIIRKPDESFYGSDGWIILRNKIRKIYGFQCMKCGLEDNTNCVDHIFPRSKYPQLELDINNMQMLCGICNIVKGNRNTKDYRDSNHMLKLTEYKLSIIK